MKYITNSGYKTRACLRDVCMVICQNFEMLQVMQQFFCFIFEGVVGEKKQTKCLTASSRIAHYSDMRTKHDQRDVEDTLSLNRQSRVEQDFKTFISDDRINACLKIQKGYQEKTDINAKRLTCIIFEVSTSF